jgi:hypothetical protein
MSFFRLIVFALAGLALAGCCASGTGCPVAMPANLAAWDGQGNQADDGAPPPEEGVLPRPASKKKAARAKTEIIVGPVTAAHAGPQSDQWWAEKEAAEQADDARLARQLKICSDCLSPVREDDTLGGAKR